MFHVEHFALVMEDGFEKYVRCSMWNIGMRRRREGECDALES